MAIATDVTIREAGRADVPAVVDLIRGLADFERLPGPDPGAGARLAEHLAEGRFELLLAEDEGLIALELERMLEPLGCELVGPLTNVDEVLQSAQRGNFDGALLDVNLRGRWVFEILPELQELGLRIIIASGYDDVTLYPAPFRGVPRVTKPFDERELRRVCEKVFANPVVR